MTESIIFQMFVGFKMIVLFMYENSDDWFQLLTKFVSR